VSSGRLIARNALFNLVGQGAPLLLAVITIPILISGLGASRFAVLALAWTAIGYFSVVDLGLAAALTQAISRRLGTDAERELPIVAGTALAMMLVLGLAGAAGLALLTPWLITGLLSIPQELQRESELAFFLIAGSLPFLVTAAGLRGIVEAHQQFGTVTALRLPFALFTFIGPVAVMPFTTDLVPIVGTIVAGRVVTWIGFAIVVRRRYRFMRQVDVSVAQVAPLMRFGGWLTMSNIISPVMSNLDRFLVAAILPLAAVAHYVTSSEIVLKLFIVPFALNAVLFPAMSSAFARDPEHGARLFERGLRLGLVAMFPIVLTLVTFAHEGLRLWVGAEFALAGADVLRWLAAAILLSAPGQLASLLLYAKGRTDLPAKAHLVELPLYMALVWLLANAYGITGVAIAWFLRVALDSSLMLAMALARTPVPRTELLRLAALGAVLLAAGAAGGLLESLTTRAAYWSVVMTGFVLLAWRHVLGPSERMLLRGMLGGGSRPSLGSP
jgi:O-antigen/teichoic acid export membrane protein